MDFKEHYLVQMGLQFWIQDENIYTYIYFLNFLFVCLIPKDPFSFKSLDIFFVSCSFAATHILGTLFTDCTRSCSSLFQV